MTEMETEYNKIRTEWVVLPDIGIGLVELTGEDALEWLQGQATNDLRGVSDSNPISFCLCEATGQLLAVCDVWQEDGRLLIASDNVQALLHRAEAMVILEDVQARDLTADYELTSIHGPTSESQVVESNGGALALRNDRLGVRGWDVWTPTNDSRKLRALSVELYEILRIEAGVPKRGADYTPKTLPPELGPAFERKHISYNKGCYTGQEVLMRLHSRGHTNKTWMGLLLNAPVEVGSKVSHEIREDAGVVTSVAVSPDLGLISAAMLRSEAAQEGAQVLVGHVRGTVKQMPLQDV
jgi:tRNA-modifying protein YgfZ